MSAGQPSPAILRCESSVSKAGFLPIPDEMALALDLILGDVLIGERAGEPESAALVLEPSRNFFRGLIGLPDAELEAAVAGARPPLALTTEMSALVVLGRLFVPWALFPLLPGDRVTIEAERTMRGFRLHLQRRQRSAPAPAS